MNIQEKSLASSLPLWLFLGPCLLFSALFVAQLTDYSANRYLLLAVSIGAVSSYLAGRKGFLLSSLLLIVLQAVRLAVFPNENWLWQAGLTSVFIITFCVIALTKEEIDALTELQQQVIANATKSHLQEKNSLQHSLDTLSHEKKQVSDSLELLQNAHQQVQHQLMMSLSKLKDKESLEGQLQDKRKELSAALIQTEELRRENRRSEDLVESLRKENEQFKSHLHIAQKNSEKQHERLQETQRHLDDKESELKKEQKRAYDCNTNLIESQEQLQTLRIKEQELQDKIDLYHTQLTNLHSQSQNLTDQLKQKITELQSQIAELQQKLTEASAIQNTPPPPLSEEIAQEIWQGKRIAGMHKQLKEQFIEKSATLDQTRRELFKVKEELLALQKEKEELTLFSQHPEISGLIKHILKLESYLKIADQQHQQECNSLHTLVSKLLADKVS